MSAGAAQCDPGEGLDQSGRGGGDGGLGLLGDPTRRAIFELLAREIEVRFTADGPEQTVVELEHRHLDRLAGGDAIRGMIVSGGGWTAILELFAKAVQ